MGQPANKISREELLTRDVYILFKENRSLKDRINILEKENRALSISVGKLKGKPQESEDDEVTFEEIAFYIDQQRRASGLTFRELSAIFNLTDVTINNYTKCKGSFKNAIKFAEKLREYVKNERNK